MPEVQRPMLHLYPSTLGLMNPSLNLHFLVHEYRSSIELITWEVVHERCVSQLLLIVPKFLRETSQLEVRFVLVWVQSFSPWLLGFLTVTSGASERHGKSNMLWRREHQGNRGEQGIWEQDMGAERGSIDHVPSLDLPPRSTFSSEFIR